MCLNKSGLTKNKSINKKNQALISFYIEKKSLSQSSIITIKRSIYITQKTRFSS